MFAGHYASALVAKALEPRAPLWTYVAGAQLLDIGWATLVMTGAERVRVDPSLPGTPLILDHMPWTHSLPAALLWGVAAAVLVGTALKLPRRAAWMLGAVVASHWLLDFLVHRPDLALWFDGPKVGLGLWNAPVLEATFEMGLLGFAAVAWSACQLRRGQPLIPLLGLFTALVALQLASQIVPLPPTIPGLALTMLSLFLTVTVLAAVADRSDPTLKSGRAIAPDDSAGALAPSAHSQPS